MVMHHSIKDSRARAVEELKVVLQQVSAIRLKDIQVQSPGAGHKVDFLAEIDVLGHSHTLACKVKVCDRPCTVRSALDELRSYTTQRAENTTPVLIAPILSEEAQALCREMNACFLDLQGNARLIVDEVFIGKRSHPIYRRPPVSSSVPDSESIAGAA